MDNQEQNEQKPIPVNEPEPEQPEQPERAQPEEHSTADYSKFIPPKESKSKGHKALNILLILMLLAAIGAAVYCFVLRAKPTISTTGHVRSLNARQRSTASCQGSVFHAHITATPARNVQATMSSNETSKVAGDATIEPSRLRSEPALQAPIAFPRARYSTQTTTRLPITTTGNTRRPKTVGHGLMSVDL